MPPRLGEILQSKGLLTEKQVQQILDHQEESGRPFGELAEKLFQVEGILVEQAWAEQYSHVTERVDPVREKVDPEALNAINRRQAWQFCIMPLRRDGRELMVVTTVESLPRAVRFVTWHLKEPVYFVLSSQEKMEEALSQYYPLPGAAAVLLNQLQ